MKLVLSVGDATARIEGTPSECAALLPHLAEVLGLGVVDLPLDDLGGWESEFVQEATAFPDDFNHTSQTEEYGYREFVRLRTGRKVETLWPLELNEPENRPSGKRSLIF